MNVLIELVGGPNDGQILALPKLELFHDLPSQAPIFGADLFIGQCPPLFIHRYQCDKEPTCPRKYRYVGYRDPSNLETLDNGKEPEDHC